MTNLEKQHLIKRENLNQAYYFQSVLQEARRLNLLTQPELEKIQLQSMQLLARQAERYTFGDSSSVKEETAQNILYSIFYTIGVYLKSFPDTDMTIEALKQKPVAELYRQGRKLVETQTEHARKIYNQVKNNTIATGNHAYNDTIENAIPAFFSVYDANYAAHDTPASIDYPVSNDKMELSGIEYICNYLQKLHMENQFCKNFTPHDIHCLLHSYDTHYQDLLINIFKIVLTNAIGCILAGKNVLRLNIEPFDREYLQQKLAPMADDRLYTILIDASKQLCQGFDITDGLLQAHITAAVPELVPGLKNALANNCLESVFVSLDGDQPQSAIKFADGRKAEDELFRNIADEIRRCRYVSDKIAIIRREIHSIADLVDILGGYCLFDDEYSQVFQSLGDMELALLLKKLPADTADTDLHYSENEKEWHHRLSSYLKNMEPVRRKRLIGLSGRIKLK